MSKLISPAAAIASAIALIAPAYANSYPTRNVEIIVSYGPGGSTDIIARIVAQKLQDRLGQSFVVLNRPGAGGTIGISCGDARAPDGYTLYNSYTAEAVIVPHISKTRKVFGGGRLRADRGHRAGAGGADGVEERQGRQPEGLHRRDARQPRQVHLRRRHRQPAARHGRLDEQAARASTSTTFPTAAARRASTTWSAATSTCSTAASPRAKPAIDSGSVKPLAVTGDKRSAALPNVPTFKEAGVPEFDLVSWTVLLAPKGTPADIVALLKQGNAGGARRSQDPRGDGRQGVERSDEPGRAGVSGQRTRQVRPRGARARHQHGQRMTAMRTILRLAALRRPARSAAQRTHKVRPSPGRTARSS